MRSDPGINRLDRIAKRNDIDYSKARHLKDKHRADRTMIARINKLPGRKTRTEGIVKKVMQAKVKLGVYSNFNKSFVKNTYVHNLLTNAWSASSLEQSLPPSSFKSIVDHNESVCSSIMPPKGAGDEITSV